MDGFAHLHTHSDYSFADGAAKITQLCVAVAKDDGKALALTDLGVLYGAIEFQRAAQKFALKPIVGVEAYLNPAGLAKPTNDPAHITLLAGSDEGLKNLYRLVSAGALDGFHAGKPQVDFAILERFADGVICLSGDEDGLLARSLMDDDLNGARWYAKKLASIYGSRLYLEIMRHGLSEDPTIERGLRTLARELSVPLIASNDAHYVSAEDHDAHHIRMCIADKKTISDKTRRQLPTREYGLKTQAEMRALFGDLPDACDLTVKLAESISLSPPSQIYHLPAFPVPPLPANGIDANPRQRTQGEYLRSLAKNGLRKRYPDRDATEDPVLMERLNSELDTIEKLGFAPYFLTVWDVMRFTRSADPPIAVGPGRGSAVGSLVSYCLGITEIDPIAHGLLFERFLNVGRQSMPDIDLDIDETRKDEVFAYLQRTWGPSSVAKTINIISTGIPSKLKAAAKAMELSDSERAAVDALLEKPDVKKFVKQDDASFELLRQRPDFLRLQQSKPKIRRLFDVAQKIDGFVDSVQTNASAIVVTPGPLTDFAPLMRARDGEIAVQYGKDSVDAAGLLKIDALSSTVIAAMQITRAQIRGTENPYFEVKEVPLDDPATFELLSRGDLVGVYQLGTSRAAAELVKKLKPQSLDDLMVAIAIIRPSCKYLCDQYLRTRAGQRPARYPDPRLEPILKDTYGVPLFQEQIMEVARAIGGFSLTEADELRSVIAKKQTTKIPRLREKFVAGAAGKRIDREAALAIFDFIEPFGEYGFNRSHAAAYALQTYRTAYLKAHYPAQFFAGKLSIKSSSDDAQAYFNELVNLKVPILLPSINESQVGFSGSVEGLRFGLSSIAGIGQDTATRIVEQRFDTGAFTSLKDFVDYFPMSSKALLTNLTLSGAFDEFGYERGHLLAQIEPILKRARMANPTEFSADDIKPLDFSFEERLRGEQTTLGYCVSSVPVEVSYSQDCTRIGDISQQDVGYDVTVGGLVRQVRTFVTQTNQEMAFIELRDRSGEIALTLRPRVLGSIDSASLKGQIIMATGRVQRARNSADKFELVADRFWKWTEDESAGMNRDAGRALPRGPLFVAPVASDGYVETPAVQAAKLQDGFEVDGTATAPFTAEARQRPPDLGIV